MTASLDTLQRKARKAREAAEAAEAAQRAARQAQEREEAVRAERARRHDEATVAGYDEAAHFREIREARQALDRALAETPLGKAWVALKLAEARHAHAAEERNSAAARIGQADNRVPSRPANSTTFEDLGKAVDRVVADLIADELDARDAARQQAIDGK